MIIVTCIAPVNIAVIKYWGKRDEDLILPLNDSLSSTLCVNHMCAKTTIMASPDFKDNRMWLNGKEESFNNPRLLNCLEEFRRRVQGDSCDAINWNIHVCSENNFPTAAGLASSAAGYACFASALAALYNVKGDISAIARQGSGSACRSVFGGWVQWHQGSNPDGSDSIATQIVPASHWPEMRILVLVVNDARKKHSSTNAMQRSAETSPFLQHRIKECVPKRIESMKIAISNRNFEEFAKLTMQDSNQFHSVCLDTYPPCVYLNDISHAIIEFVHAYNAACKKNKIAYTFDAGPNACLYMLEEDVSNVISQINVIFPTEADPVEYFRGYPVEINPVPENLLNVQKQKPGLLKYIIYTKVGNGPEYLTKSSDHLLNEAGFPKV